MPEESYPSLFRMAVLAYLILLPAGQWITFGELERRMSRADEGHVRDHIVRALVRGFLIELAIILPVFLVWGGLRWSSLRWDVLLGGDILLGFCVLTVGITALTIRLALNLLEKLPPEEDTRGVFILRLSVLVAGAGYGVAVWIVVPGGPGETMVSLFLLGAVLTVLGLNRTADLPMELLERLSETVRRRR
jgi:hypothetical protein